LRARQLKRQRAREYARGLRRLTLQRVEQADAERIELDAVQQAAKLEMYRLHDDPRVTQQQMFERWKQWEPALIDMDPMARLRFGWELFKRFQPLLTGRPATWVEFLDLVNANVMVWALSGEAQP
jgi:hypothetical protein